MTQTIQQKADEPFIQAPAFSENYMQQRCAILDDAGSSIWLKTAICVLEVRDPVDAFNDTEILRKLAFLRMETAFRTT